MVGIAILGGLLIGAVVLLALRAYALPGAGAAARIEQIEAYGFNSEADTHGLAAEGDDQPAFGEVARSLGQWLMNRSPQIREDEVKRELQQAGMYKIAATTFTGYRVAAALLAGGAFVLFAVSGRASPALLILGAPLAVAGGFTLPHAVLKRKIEKRFEEIEYQLPELVDILVVTVESGLALSRSFQVAAKRMTGPLGEELRLTLQQQEMGLGMNDALLAMLERADTPSMRSFVRSVTQGEQLGVSIGEIMRNLAREMRTRRRQAAEARAHKAPVKILFPLILLIFPALFLVLLYPAIHEILNGLG